MILNFQYHNDKDVPGINVEKTIWAQHSVNLPANHPHPLCGGIYMDHWVQQGNWLLSLKTLFG